MTTVWAKPDSPSLRAKSGIDWVQKQANAWKAKPEDSDIADLLIKAWVALDDSRGRSQQKEIGPSKLGGCRRQVFYQLLDAPKVNHGIDRLGALLGTAMHDHIEKAFALLGDENLFNEIEVPGIEGLIAPGHIDFYDAKQKRIVDWKGSKLKSLRYFPSKGYRWQAMVYGYLAIKADYEVDRIEIVAIPRDGKTRDIKVHSEPYDESEAVKALDWLREVKGMALQGDMPAAEPSPLCEWCPWFGKGACEGK